MNHLIHDSILNGKYVQIVGSDDGSTTTVEKHRTIFFDASECRKIPTWKETLCNVDIKGSISFITFPDGYMPEIHLDDTIYRYSPDNNGSSPSKMIVISDSIDLYKSYRWYIKHKNDTPPSLFVRDVYTWHIQSQYWRRKGIYRDTEVSTIIGMSSIFDAVMKDINIILEKKDILDALGMSPSANYLLTSRPGMGKTSLIRAICTSLNVAMHVIDADSMRSSNPESIFQKTSSKDQISVYLFEDFDRYLDNTREEHMAGLLNALDGVETMPTSIRFFTANSHVSGERMDAFLSRMRRNITLSSHGSDAYMRSVKVVFPSMDSIMQNSIVSLFARRDITMRVANQILCASMIYDHPLEYIESAVNTPHMIKSMPKVKEVDDGEVDTWYE